MKYILYIFCLIVSTSLFAQNPQWVNYSRDFIIRDIEFDNNYVWISTYGGLVRYDRITKTHVLYNGSNSGLMINDIGDLLLDDNDDLWIASGGIQKFDKSSTWTDYSAASNGDTLYQVARIRKDYSGIIHVLSRSQFPGYKIYKFDGTIFQPLISPIQLNSYIDFDVDGYGNLWVATIDGVWKYDGITWVQSFFGERVDAIKVDTTNNIWISENKVTTNTGSIHKYNGISWSYISPIVYLSCNRTYLDNNNHVWFYGYNVNGFYECYGNTVQYHPYSINTQPWASPTSFAIDEYGEHWLGLSQADSVFYHKKNGIWNKLNFSNSNISSPQLRNLAIDSVGNIWIATTNGLSKFNGYTFTNYTEHNSGINSNYLNDVFIDSDGHIWLTSNDNNSNTPPLARFDGNTWTSYNIAGFTSSFNVVEDSLGNIYVSTFQGLARYNGQNWTIYNTSNSPLPVNYIRDVKFDNTGVLWIATYGGGVVKFDGVNWITYNSSNSGLMSDYCFQLFCDNSNNIWVITNIGWAKFNNGNWITNATANIGVPYNMFQDKNSDIWAGISPGLGKFDGTAWTIYYVFNTGLTSGVQAIVIDDANNKWIATSSGGLVIFNENGVDIETIRNISRSKISGKIYHDINSSGIQDTLEYGLNAQKILKLPDSTITFTNNFGNFTFKADSGHYNISSLPYNNWSITSDSLQYTVQLDTIDLSGYDFGFNFLQSLNDVELLVSSYIPRCHAINNYILIYRNKGTSNISGTINFTIDTATSYIQSFPDSPSVVNNTYSWMFYDLKPFETRQIIVRLQMPDFNSMGDTLQFIADVFTNQTIAATYTLNEELVCAYDPNDKLVRPVGWGNEHLILKNTELEYTIRFQNTGNDTAFYILLVDTLSPFLDISTLDFISSSHNCTVFCTANGTLKFTFENVLLPPSETDDPNSNGYVIFKIKPKAGLPDSTIIFNNVSIYFDFNPAIETNTVFNTLVDNILTNVEFQNVNHIVFNIYPNPSSGNFNIIYLLPHTSTGSASEEGKLEVFDVTGKIVYEMRFPQWSTLQQISLPAYISSGLYNCVITAGSHRMSKKIAIIRD